MEDFDSIIEIENFELTINFSISRRSFPPFP